ncbi:hypothetical protein F4775DRAFT_531002 [Biscogniauxia sp. FL1348]|nr:hypothetical protein F4775DRAFT_531002 [Biscogniauxia sp. FL1348]
MARLWRSYAILRTSDLNDANGKRVYGKLERMEKRRIWFTHILSMPIVLELLGVHLEYQRLGAWCGSC